MNANELADELENLYNRFLPAHSKFLDILKSATMLRQQQTEIDALKKEAALQRLSDFTQEADNEPVAWINKDDSSLSFKKHGGGWQPLYTHPAKTLTDEEIIALWFRECSFTTGDLLKFARAILKKASER